MKNSSERKTKGFFNQVLASAIGFVLGNFMFFGSIFILIIVISVIGSIFDSSEKIEPNTIVKMKFDYTITDKPNTDPFMNFNLLSEFEPNNSKHLYSVLRSIKTAGDNENISGMLLDLRGFQSPGMASIKEIRDALREFKQKGKFIYAYSTYFNKTSYYLASVSDSVFMYPTGMLELSGLSSTIPFFTETMSEIGIKPEIIRHGKFKAAVEPFMLTEMSEENRQQTEILLNDVWTSMLVDISQSRQITIEDLNKIADDLTLSMLPEKPVEKRLIDELIYPDKLNDLLAAKINQENDIEFFSLFDLINEESKSKNKIAIIYAEGNIDGDANNIHSDYTKTIKKVFENDDIDAVVFRVNSPGGSALISDEILTQMKLSKKDKPIVVSMGNYAASGGYYISCAADKILASENTITGSIGVFGLFFTGEELLTEKMKLHYDNVKTNKFANLGEIHRSLSKEEKSIIQISIKNTYNEFINHVSTARNMTIEEVDAIGQGRVWTGLRSEKIGLVDSIGGLHDAIQTAAQLANLEDFNVVEYPKSKTGLENIIADLEVMNQIKKHSIEDIYLNQLKEKFLNMQGIQARLPIEYKLD